MKKLISLLLAFSVMFVLSACGEKQPQSENTGFETFDKEYWQYAVENSQTYTTIGVGSMASSGENVVTADEIIEIAEKIEYWKQIDFAPFPSQRDMMHYLYINNRQGDRGLTVEFYDDFGIVAISDGPLTDSEKTYYSIGNAEEQKQFFTDKNMYFSVEERIKVSDFVYDYFSHKSTTEINDDFNGLFVRLDGTVEKMTVNSISRMPVYDGSHYYVANICIRYKYSDNTHKSYIFIARVENSSAVYEDFKIANLEVQETENLPATDYTIAGKDYSLWMEKLDAPYYNGFMYSLGGGNGWTSSSDGQWNYNVMNCITQLSLGEEVPLPQHSKNNFVSVTLVCENKNYNLPALNFKFIDDCNYVIICDCNMNNTNNCYNHTTAFKVNNPQTVIDTFDGTGRYISSADYRSMEKYIHEEILSMTSDQINEISVNEDKLPEKLSAGRQINDLHIINVDHRTTDNGREDYQAKFRAFYYNDELNIYKQIDFGVLLYRKGNSFETDSLYAYQF